MAVVDSFDENSNFWEQNKQLRIREPFKSLYRNDKSKGKSKSSKMMWYIALIYDFESKYYPLPFEQRVELLDEGFWENKEFFDKHEDTIITLGEAYEQHQDTPAIRAMKVWQSKITERAQFIKDTPYRLEKKVFNEETGKLSYVEQGTVKILDDMVKLNGSMFDEFQRIWDMLMGEESEGKVKGNPASESDTGSI